MRERFDKDVDSSAKEYTQSVSFDILLYDYDIDGSIAHARMLARQGIIAEDEANRIIEALESIRSEIDDGDFVPSEDLEDVHMNIEARLIDKVGDVGRKLHTSRSRNDQVALDMRMFVKDVAVYAVDSLAELQEAIVKLAEENMDVVAPGYTHMQRAQPVLLSHHLLAYFEMFQRDVERFSGCWYRADVLPLGSGALAGVPYPVDREFLAGELGFGRISQNSMDAVSDRDFVIEFQAASSITMMHLSRLAEELILWSTSEFGFIELDDAYATTSSMMPQKKNPDVAELARGKTGRVYGHLMAILTTMKALPLAYNRDMQEDKEGLFDTVGTLLATLDVFAGMLSGLRVNREAMRRAADGGYMLATDIADYLVNRGVPFRKAHGIVGRLVRYASGKGKSLSDLSIDEYRKHSPQFDDDVLSITLDSSIAARDVAGGTARRQVELQLERAKQLLRGEDE